MKRRGDEKPEGEPFSPTQSKPLVGKILRGGFVDYDVPHFKEELANDGLDINDAMNALQRGVFNEPEFENGEWRYQVHTHKCVVVFAFVSLAEIQVITIWKRKK